MKMKYTIEIDNYQLISKLVTPILDWLYENIGERYSLWDWHYTAHSHGPDKFFFKYEEDKVKFILRWL